MNTLVARYTASLFCVLALLSCKPAPVPPQEATDATPVQEETTPDAEDRVVWQKPQLVIDLLGDLHDKTVADIGAGAGFFALRLAPMAEHVIAIDIEPRFVEYLDSVRYTALPNGLYERLETRLAEPANAGLKPGEADCILIVNTYMYLPQRVAYLRHLRTGLAPKGRILIVDFKKKMTALGPPKNIRIPQYQVEEELEQAGYRILTSDDTSLEFQYIIMADKVND